MPGDDRVAQMIRAGWNQAVVVDVPDGVRLERPLVVRWGVGAPARALITRTFVRLGRGASRVGRRGDRAVARSRRAAGGAEGQALLRRLDRGHPRPRVEARLSRRSRRRAEHQVVFQHRVAAIGEGATLKWALGQLGSRLVRAAIDNRLEGDRSSVEQVEIVFGSEDQLFDLTSYTSTSGATRRATCSPRRCSRTRPDVPQGPGHDREDRRSGPTRSWASTA